MYISPQYKFIYLAIPRTASRTTRNWVVKDYGAVMSGGHHTMTWTNEPEIQKAMVNDYFVFTTIRNPYKRMLSYWRHTYEQKSTEELLELFVRDVSAMVVDIRRDGQPGVVPGFPRPQTVFLDQAKTIFPNIHVVDIKDLKDNFSKLPFVDKPVELERVGQAGNSVGDWTAFYRQKPIREKIFQYFQRDFQELGFRRRLLD